MSARSWSFPICGSATLCAAIRWCASSSSAGLTGPLISWRRPCARRWSITCLASALGSSGTLPRSRLAVGPAKGTGGTAAGLKLWHRADPAPHLEIGDCPPRWPEFRNGWVLSARPGSG